MNAVVKDVMTPDVITVSKDTSFEVIAAALREHRVSAFPVLDEASQVIGVVSESDLLAKLALGIEDPGTVPGMITGIVRRQQLKKAHAVTAAELMTSPPYTVRPQDTVEQAARIMYLRNVKRLPVVDADGRLAGIVSRADVLAVYSRTDADIAEEIRTGILSTETPANPGTLDVGVTAGRGHDRRPAANPRTGTRDHRPGPARPGYRRGPRPARLSVPRTGPLRRPCQLHGGLTRTARLHRKAPG